MFRAGLLSLIVLLGGCATTNKHPDDPWESYNRKVFALNVKLDNAIVKPMTKGYRAITPNFVEMGVTNFFSNIGDVGNSVNNLLQGNPVASGSDILRIVINSTVGFGGLVDVASWAGLTKHDEDFGQTLGAWRVGAGPYVMLPLLGPASVRDAGALLVDYSVDPVTWVQNRRLKNSLVALDLLDTRSTVMKAEAVIGDDFYDRYAMIRNAYLGHRKAQVSNGKEDDELLEDDDLIRELEGL